MVRGERERERTVLEAGLGILAFRGFHSKISTTSTTDRDGISESGWKWRHECGAEGIRTHLAG